KRFALLSLRVSAPPRETNLLRPLLAESRHSPILFTTYPNISTPPRTTHNETGRYHYRPVSFQ
ncbi:hypothetical protein, partial [Sphingobium jiangsuense]|uniref:hypothetical protein n=1 Tax=Sphingobium jiangsuense TaxID=870476 RepID=UPI0024E19198